MANINKDFLNKKELLFLLLLLLASFSFAFINYSGYIPNRQYMTTIFLMQDSSFLKNDFYVQDYAGFNFRYFFAKIFLLSDKLFNNFDVTLPFLSALTIFLISLNIYLLSYFYFKDRGYSVLISVISIFLVHFNLGGNALI